MIDLIGAHVAHLRAAGYSRNTIRDREELLRRIDRDTPMGLALATVDELSHWLGRDGWSAQTRATYYGHVAGFFEWACNPNNPVLDWNPARSLTKPRVPARVPRPASDDALADLLARTFDPYRVWIMLAAYAGLRCCEVATVRREDITEEVIVVAGKGGKVATVPTHPEIWALVRDLPAGRVARDARGALVTPEYVSSKSRYHINVELKIPRVSLHRLRHWLGTTALRQTHDLRVVQELLRHASPASTAAYTQISSEQRRSAIHALPALAPATS